MVLIACKYRPISTFLQVIATACETDAPKVYLLDWILFCQK